MSLKYRRTASLNLTALEDETILKYRKTAK